LAAALALLGAVGCGSDSHASDEALSGEGPLYAIMYEVFDDVGSNSYLSLLESLDIEELDTTKAREYAGGRAFLHAYDGAVFVGDAGTPSVTRYSVLHAGEQRFDPEWTLDYSTVTDGHQGAMFTYLKDGQALVSGFYDENTSFDETTSTWSYAGSLNWRVFTVDLESGTGSPLEGLGFNGGAFTPARFDDRLFLMVPGGEEQNWESQVYELEDGAASPRVKVPGWSYQHVKIR
jgi:hypothetical protein